MSVAKPSFAEFQRHHPLARGCVFAATFNEGAGNTAYAFGVDGRHECALANTTWSLGQFGRCLSFNSSRVEIADNPSLNLTTSFTFAAWIYKRNTTYGVIYNSGQGVDAGQWRLSVDASNQLDFTEEGVASFTGGTVATNQWTHVAVTKSGDTGTNVRFWVNGQPSGTASVGGVATPNGLKFFGVRWESGAQNAINALIDLPIISSRSLDAAEIRQLYYDPLCLWTPQRRVFAGLGGIIKADIKADIFGRWGVIGSPVIRGVA